MGFAGTTLSAFSRAILARLHAVLGHHVGDAGVSFIARLDRLLLRFIHSWTVGPGTTGVVDPGG